MLETSLLINPRARLVEVLVDSLLTARRPYGDVLLWPEKAESVLIGPAPSPAHTARAVRMLASVQATQPSSQVQEALEQAVAWLIEQRDLHNAYEVTERPAYGGLERIFPAGRPIHWFGAQCSLAMGHSVTTMPFRAEMGGTARRVRYHGRQRGGHNGG
jgi:hypothetical protein